MSTNSARYDKLTEKIRKYAVKALESPNYQEWFEEYENPQELETVIDELEERGYQFRGRRGVKKPDSRLDQIADIMGIWEFTEASFMINGSEEGEKIYALNEKDYETLEDIREEVLEK